MSELDSLAERICMLKALITERMRAGDLDGAKLGLREAESSIHALQEAIKTMPPDHPPPRRALMEAVTRQLTS